MTKTRRLRGRAAAPFTVLLLLGCSDDTGEETREPPPPELTIVAVRTPSGATWQPGAPSLDLGCPPSRALVVQLGEPDPNGDRRSLKNWLLRAPGACGTRERCGYVSFELAAAGSVVYRTDTALSEFGIAAEDVAAPPGLSAGVYTLRATLRNNDGTEFLLRGEPISASAELTLTTPAECVSGPAPDAGSDAGS